MQVVSGVPARKREISRVGQFLVRCTASGRAEKTLPASAVRAVVCAQSRKHDVSAMSGKMAALQGEAHFFEESMNPMKVKEYLSRPKVKRDSAKNVFMQREASRQATPSNPNLAT